MYKRERSSTLIENDMASSGFWAAIVFVIVVIIAIVVGVVASRRSGYASEPFVQYEDEDATRSASSQSGRSYE